MYGFYLIALLLLSQVALGEQKDDISTEDRSEYYKKSGMKYAEDLYQTPENPESELKSIKAENLSLKIQQKAINNIKGLLKHEIKNELKCNLIDRLASLYNERADILGHIPNRAKDQNIAWEDSLNEYTKLKNSCVAWKPDIIRFRIAEILEKLKKSKQAETSYMEIVRKYPDSTIRADALLALGNIHFDNHQFSIAMQTYQKILSTRESKLYPYAHYKMAWCLFNSSDFQEALNELQATIISSREIEKNHVGHLGIEDEALNDLVLFFAEHGNPNEAKIVFSKLVGPERAKILRFDLARRLFEYGKHDLAKAIAGELLQDNPDKSFAYKLYFIQLNIAERTRDRSFGIAASKNLTDWLKNSGYTNKEAPYIDSEEYIRHYAEKLHHEAETLKIGDIWTDARKAYEIYLHAFSDEAETPEVKFRYSVLLMNRKEYLNAYSCIHQMLKAIGPNHNRYEEAHKLRIQAIELLSKEDRKKIDNIDILFAYDEYANKFPNTKEGPEAAYKAAEIAKSIETAEQIASRFEKIADTWPNFSLAKNAREESIATLAKANLWEHLQKSTEDFKAVDPNNPLEQKIVQANELAKIKITENLEKQGKYKEAKLEYEKYMSKQSSDTIKIYALTRLAFLAEQENDYQKAIEHLEKLYELYPKSNEGINSSLELGRLYTKIAKPKLASSNYLKYIQSKKPENMEQALTNTGLLLQDLANYKEAAEVFFQLSQFRKNKNMPLQSQLIANDAACTNMLQYSYQIFDSAILDVLQKCELMHSKTKSENALEWKTHLALYKEKLKLPENDWAAIADSNPSLTQAPDLPYIALARLRILNKQFAKYQQIQFSDQNANPEANILKKNKALEKIEQLVEKILPIATKNQAMRANITLHNAYLNFAETMERAALPKNLSSGEKEQIKLSFLNLAKNFREKAESLTSISAQERIPSSTNASAHLTEIPKLSSKDEALLYTGTTPLEILTPIYARAAYHDIQIGDFNEAHYFLASWFKNIKEIKKNDEPLYGLENYEILQQVVEDKLHNKDPLSEEL